MIKSTQLQIQYQQLKEDIDQAIKAVLEESAFIGGKRVSSFEEAFAHFQQVNFCIGVANGTDALEIALESLDLPPESEVIVPVFTFIATAEAVIRMGYTVVFADCATDTFTIDPEDIVKKITSKTKAIIAVHLYGQAAEMKTLQEIAKKHDLYIIEDAAQAHGTQYHDKPIGSFGDLATFSFYPSKNLGAYGDGGAVVTNNKKLAEKVRMIANHGQKQKYQHLFVGRNSRLDGLQAAILAVKLKQLPTWLEYRQQVASWYQNELNDFEHVVLPKRKSHIYHTFHQFVILAKKRDQLQKYLLKTKIETAIHYPNILIKQPAFNDLPQARHHFEIEKVSKMALSLPIGLHIKQNDVKRIASQIKKFYN